MDTSLIQEDQDGRIRDPMANNSEITPALPNGRSDTANPEREADGVAAVRGDRIVGRASRVGMPTFPHARGFQP